MVYICFVYSDEMCTDDDEVLMRGGSAFAFQFVVVRLVLCLLVRKCQSLWKCCCKQEPIKIWWQISDM